MIENLLDKIELFARIEHIFAVAAVALTVVVFICCLWRCKRGEKSFRRPALVLGMLLVFVVVLYGSSVVLAEEETEPAPIFVFETENEPETSVFSEKTKLWINAKDITLRIKVEEILQPQEMTENEKTNQEHKAQTGNSVYEAEGYGTECILFDVPDGTAFSFVVQACRDENVEESISFIINKRKGVAQKEPVEEEPCPAVPTKDPQITAPPSEADIVFEDDPLDEPEQDKDRTETPDPQIDISVSTQPTVVPANTERKDPGKNEVPKEEYTVTIRPDGSVFTIASDTQKVIHAMYLSEPSQLTIVEINKERLESRNITYTLNGETTVLKEDKDFTVTEEKTREGWKYRYHLQEDLFDKDGYYQINITSTDKEGKKSNNKTAGAGIEFVMDRTAPEIMLNDLESNRTYTEVPHVYYLTVRDNIGIEKLTIYKNEEIVEELWYSDGKWVDGQTKIERLSDGGTLKLELNKSGEYCDYRFEVSDKSRNCTSYDIFHVRTVRKRKGMIPALAAGGIVLSVFIIKINLLRKRNKNRTRP